MARVTYQDATITEYDDGTEEVRFTDAEWERMLADPAFGYVCHNGHRLNDSDHRFMQVEGMCPSCFADAEAWGEDDIAEALALGEADPDPRPLHLRDDAPAAADIEPF